MKLFQVAKDGGPESHVTGYFIIEIKRLFSIVLLRFDNGSREAYHSHAFHSLSWVLKGKLIEENLRELCGHKLTLPRWMWYKASWRPIVTQRDRFHKVSSVGRTWVLSFRGQWSRTWREYLPNEGRVIKLAHGRREVA